MVHIGTNALTLFSWNLVLFFHQTSGHYLSAAALMWASTHNMALLAKLNTLVKALEECQTKLGTGYLSAFPSEFFDRFESIQPVWAPYYTIHKVLSFPICMFWMLFAPLPYYVDQHWLRPISETESDWPVAVSPGLKDHGRVIRSVYTHGEYACTGYANGYDKIFQQKSGGCHQSVYNREALEISKWRNWGHEWCSLPPLSYHGKPPYLSSTFSSAKNFEASVCKVSQSQGVLKRTIKFQGLVVWLEELFSKFQSSDPSILLHAFTEIQSSGRFICLMSCRDHVTFL